jgi:hypothetical protein
LLAVTGRGGPFGDIVRHWECALSLRRVPCCVFFCLLLVLVGENYSPLVVHAGIGFQPPNPEELKMTSEPLAPGAAAIILYRQVDRDDNGRTSHEDNYVRIKVFNEEGRKYANVELPFMKEREDVVNIRARTIKSDGTIVNFDGKVFERAQAKGRGMQFLVKTFTLPDVEVGSLLEYTYTYDFSEKYIFDSRWIINGELFTRSASFSLRPFKSRSVFAPFPLRWTWQGLPTGVQPTQGPDGVVHLQVSNIAAFPEEDHMPPPDELKARVDFTYQAALLARDSDKFWNEFGKKQNGELENFVGKRKAMEDAVAQIVSPNDPPEVKLRKIYDRVQQIRNKSYELRKTEQEEKREGEKPAENVEEVWKRGYGSGVQLTWLYLGLVRAAGFEAYGCLVSDRRQYFFNPKTLQSSKLDANVVQVKLNGKDVYFDPGAEYTPFGMLTWSETGVTGLKLDKDGGAWIRTPLPAAAESRIERKGQFALSEGGDLEGKLTVTYSGLEAMYQRLDVRHDDDVARKKFLEERVKAQVPAAMEVELVNQPDWSGTETPLVAEYDVKIPGWASNAGKRVVLPVGVFTAVEKHIFEHTERVHAIYFDYPYQKNDDIIVTLPAGWQVSSVPPAQNEDGHIVTYSIAAENGKDRLHLTRKLTVDFLILEPKYYGALRNFFQVVRTGDEEQIVLQPGSANAKN